MVISDEIKFPKPVQVDPFKAERKVEATDAVFPLARVGAFKREWSRRQGQGKRSARARRQLNPDEEGSVRRLVERINNRLEDQRIGLHLVLVKDEDGFALDVYDCTDNIACTVVKDIFVSLEDLPVLLKNLEEEAGLIIDTVS